MSRTNIAVLAAVMLACGSAGAQEIAWQTNYAQARQLAAEQKRLILIHFFTDHCEPCRLVDKEVFPDRNVVDAVERNFIPVKLHEKDNPELVRRYGINRFPSDVIVTHAGLPLHRGLTPTNVREYTLLLNNVAMQSGVGANRTEQAATTSVLPSHDQLRQWKQQAQQTAGDAANQAQQSAGQMAGQVASQATDAANQKWQAANQSANQAWQGANDKANQAVNQAGQAANGAKDQALAKFNGYTQQANGWLANNTQAPPAAGGAGPYATGAPPEQPQPVNNPYTGSAPVVAEGAPTQTNAPAYGPQGYPQPGTQQAVPQGTQPQTIANRYLPAGDPVLPRTPAFPPQGPPGAYAQQSQLGKASFEPQITPQPSAVVQGPNAVTAPPQMVPVNQAPGLGLDGFCPILLLEKKAWRRGDARWGAIHRGRTYLFSSEEAQAKFMSDPDRFAPLMSGYDPVHYSTSGKLAAGKRDFGVVYRNQIYLFENAATREVFEKSPERFVGPVQQAMLHSEQAGTTYR